MRAEEAVHEVIAEILRYSDHAREPYRDRQLSWYAERVDAARQQMDRCYAQEQRLALLARSVGMSEFTSQGYFVNWWVCHPMLIFAVGA